MKPRITDRPAQPLDGPFARAVHHAAYREVSLRQFGRWDLTEQDGFFARGWRPDLTIIIHADGVPCGYAQIADLPDEVHLGDLAILPEFQRRGIGTAVVQSAMSRAKARGVRLRLQVLHQNGARKLYLRLGLREYSRTSSHVLMEWSALR